MKKWVMSYWLALKYSLPHLKAIVIKAAKVFGAIALIEFLLLVGFYFLQNDWFLRIFAIFLFQSIAFLIVFPLVLISVVLLYRPKESNRIHHATMIWIWQAKAYLPTLVETTPAHFEEDRPIYIADLTQSSLTEAMRSVKEAGHHHELTSSKNEDPLVEITKAKSREALGNESIVFIIKWSPVSVELERIDGKTDKFERMAAFPLDVSLNTISETILTSINV